MIILVYVFIKFKIYQVAHASHNGAFCATNMQEYAECARALKTYRVETTDDTFQLFPLHTNAFRFIVRKAPEGVLMECWMGYIVANYNAKNIESFKNQCADFDTVCPP